MALHRPVVRARTPSGFTLTEAMITLAVLIVLLAIAAPQIMGYIQRKAAQSAAAELASDLRMAKSRQMAGTRTDQQVRIAFGANDVESCYVVYVTQGTADCDCTARPACPDAAAAGLEQVLLRVFPKTGSLHVSPMADTPSRVAFASPHGLLVEPGTPGSAGARPTSLAIELQSAHGGVWRVLDNPTGAPSVCSVDGDATHARCP